jgi:hypothetical protein
MAVNWRFEGCSKPAWLEPACFNLPGLVIVALVPCGALYLYKGKGCVFIAQQQGLTKVVVASCTLHQDWTDKLISFLKWHSNK